MTQTYKASTITKYIRKNILEDNAQTLGLRAVFYGDQELIPKAPAVCVIPAVLRRAYNQTGIQTQNEFELSLLIYSSDLRKSIDDIQEACDVLTEEIADLINVKASPASRGLGGDQFGGLIMEALTIGIEYGYSSKPDVLMRMNRIIVSGSTRTFLTEA